MLYMMKQFLIIRMWPSTYADDGVNVFSNPFTLYVVDITTNCRGIIMSLAVLQKKLPP